MTSDRDSIVNTLARYGQALDDKNFAAAGACFTDDAQATFSGVRLPPGREAIVAHLTGLGSLAASTHLLGLAVIEFADDGASATAGTTAIAFLAGANGGPVRTRGLRYLDRFVRLGNGWLISERTHRVDWMTEQPSTPL